MLSDRCLSCLPVCNVCVYLPNGWMDQNETYHGGIGIGPGHIVLDGDPAPPTKGALQPALFGPCLLRLNGHPFQQLLSSCLCVGLGSAIRVFFWFSLDCFVLVLFASVLLPLVSSVLRNGLFLC